MGDNLFGYDAACLNAIHDGIQECTTIQYINMLSHFDCPEGMAQKFFELTQSKPLAECVLMVKMDTFTFQNTRQLSIVNKRKMAKEATRRRLAQREAGEIGKSTATGRKCNFAESYGSAAAVSATDSTTAPK
jgi:hypothetical protein